MRLRLPLTLALTTLACGRPPTEAPHDAGIDLPDVAPVDAALAPDVGVDASDDGICGAVPYDANWAELPSTCLPRCSAATRAAVEACNLDQSCEQAAIDADTTPSTHVDLTGYGPIEVRCGLQPGSSAYNCHDWQAYSCLSETCPMVYRAYSRCYATGAACTAEAAAVDQCTTTSAFAACFAPRWAGCFPSD